MQTKQEQKFCEQWPACLDSMEALYAEQMPLPDECYQHARESLQGLRQQAATNEIEKALRQLWAFDERFFGEVPGFGSGLYEWAVYSLCYLCKDEKVIGQDFSFSDCKSPLSYI